ncbi:MAG: glycosyltransferase family 2 protein, partial [Lachnospiraceae bacterium]|nr:glycosyltransferase family 2 protein [Lachnospiraceae bacterium]
MPDVTIVIPNYNGMAVLDTCLHSALNQKGVNAQVIVVDNGSTDGSQDYISRKFPECELVSLDQNYGFSRAVNEGVRRAKSKYVILLNNDTEAEPDFAARLFAAIRRHKRCFSCQACMLQYQDRALLDSAGDLYCALGWAFSRGKGKPADAWPKGGKIFSSCAGAAIYRRSVIEKLGGFDEAHFVYLEDVDICWRARLMGYENRYEPRAKVYHMGSASSGSRHNSFKVGYA